MRILAWVAAGIAATILVAGSAAAAIPGPQRALCPQCFGLTDIGNDVFTDVPGRAGDITALTAAADREAARFFGDLQSRPRMIFCGSADCLATFGGGSTGVTYASLLVRIAPQGFAPYIVTHERIHAELAARAGLAALVGDALPVWFNEGLATYLAGDTRYPGPFGPDDISWVRQGTTRAEWNRLLGERDWMAGYGAAEAAIATLDRSLGRDRLRTIAILLAAGETFDEALTMVGG